MTLFLLLPILFALKPLLPALAPNTDLQSFCFVKPFPFAFGMKPLLFGIPLPLMFALKPLLLALAPTTDVQSFSLGKPLPPAVDPKPLLLIAPDCSTADDCSSGFVFGRSGRVPDAGTVEVLSQANAAEGVAFVIARLQETGSQQILF